MQTEREPEAGKGSPTNGRPVSRDECLVEALVHVARGFSTLPLRTTKEPNAALIRRTRGSGSWRTFRERPADEEEVRAWLDTDPETSIGILTGEACGGLVVLDDDGAAPLVELPTTATVRTGRGRHFYFRSPEPLSTRSFPWGEIRAEGAYVAAPLSLHPSGVRYRWHLTPEEAGLADFRATLPPRFAYDVMRALRQTLAAGVRYGYLGSNPAVAAGDNPAPTPRPVRAHTLAELEALEAELGASYGPFVPFVAATGLRPLEAARVERRDLDRARRVLTVRGTKTARSRREVPLARKALMALDRIPAQLATPLLFPAPEGGPLNLNNFRRREWLPAVEASGVARPARIYDLRSTFASNALAAGVTVFDLAKVMGTSVGMVERHYGTLLGGAHLGIVGRLDALDAEAEAGHEAR